MDKYGKLAKNTGAFFIANFGSKILTFLLVRFYTELLTTEEYGVLDLINTTVNLAVPIVTLCITEAVLRFSIDDIDNRKSIFSLGFAIAVVGNIAFLVTAPVLAYLDTFKGSLVMMYLISLTHALNMVCAHFSRGIGQTRVFAMNGFLLTALQVGLNIIFLVGFSMGIKGYLWATFLSNLLTTVYIFLRGKLYKYISWNFDGKYLKGMLKYSVPFIPNTIFWWIMQSSNRYVILIFLSEGYNGLYAAANKIPTIISTITSIFFQAWQLSSVDEAKSEDKDKFYSEIFSLTSLVVFGLASVIMVFVQPIYRILVDESFYAGWTCIPFLMLATVFSSISAFFSTNYVAMKKTNGVFVTTLIGAVVNFVLTLILTPIWDIRGAALATAISFAITAVARAFDTRKFAKITCKFRSFWLPMIIIIAQAVLLTIGVESMLLQAGLCVVLIILCFPEILDICKKMFTIAKGMLKRGK